MTDWQIIDSDNLPELPPGKPPQLRLHQHWFWLAGSMAVLLIAGFVALYERRAERRAVLREDLEAFIFEEETLRFLGDQGRGADLIVPGAPPAWQQVYWQTFKTGGAHVPPDFVQVNEIDFADQCAVITVDLAGHEQVRAYCLSNQQWRRAPVPATAWSNKQIIPLANGGQLHFQSRDRAFAEALANDLPLLLEKLDQWAAIPPAAATSPPADLYSAIEIAIEPHELRPPLISHEGQRIVLNSPWLALSPEGALSGEAAVRLALAEALLRHARPVLAETPQPLPGAARFLAATQTVAAMHLMLSPEAQAALLDTWRRQLAGQWASPFFVDLQNPPEPAVAQQAELAARLTVEYIYHLNGLDVLALLLPQLHVTHSWDRLFQTTLNRSTLVLEEEAAVYAEVNLSVTSTDDSLSFHLPLTATLLRLEPTPNGYRAYVELPDQVNPLLVELPGEVIQTFAGASLPFACVPPGARLEITGEWLEIQRRLQAAQVTMPDVGPLAIKPAPADTLAYLIEGESTPQALVALSSQGALQHLTALSPTLQVFPLPVAAGEQLSFLFRLDLPHCERAWFARYEPRQGITGQWLAPPRLIQWVWRADQQDLLFFSPRNNSLEYDIYQTNPTLSPELMGSSNAPLLFMGWNVESGRLVATTSWFDEAYLGLLDPASGDITPLVQPYYRSFRARTLSPEGAWVAYLIHTQRRLGPPDQLEALEVTGAAKRTLLQVEPDEGLEPPVWSLYLAQSTLAILAGPIVEGYLRPSRLLITSPDQPGSYTVMTQAAAGEQLAMPVFCANGALLYRAEQGGQYHLRQQLPRLRAKTLLTLDYPFQPLACP